MAIAFLESLRAALSFAERAQNAELLGAFQKALLEGQDIIDANLRLREEHRTLQDEIRTLELKLAFSEKLVFIHGLYHAPDSDGRIGEPFCPTCWESNRLAVHLHWEQAMKGYLCNSCDRQFEYTRRNPVLTRGHVDEGYATPSSRWNPDNKPPSS